MPLPGGATDKIGNRFEGHWTTKVMVEVLAEEADSVWLEPLGEEGDGVEFRVAASGDRSYHQVKRQTG